MQVDGASILVTRVWSRIGFTPIDLLPRRHQPGMVVILYNPDAKLAVEAGASK